MGLSSPDAFSGQPGVAADRHERADRQGRPRFTLVDSMRGLAAMSVVLYHVTFSFGFPGTVLAYVSQRISGPPFSAVVVFFLISGFVLYRPFAEARFAGSPSPSLVPYAVRRVARIVPGYWVALAIVSLMLSEHEVHTPLGALRYFGFAQLYGNWDTTAQGGISPAWTLCVEVTFYAALPLLGMGIRRLGRGRSFLASELGLCAGIALLSLIWQAALVTSVPVSDPWLISLLDVLPGTLDLFAWGMALAALSVAVEHRAWTARWILIVERFPELCWLLGIGAFTGVGVLGDLSFHHFAAWWLITHELKALGSALLLAPLVLGDQQRGPLRRLLASRPLLYLGTVSYGVYLWHFPLLHELAPHLIHHGELFTFVGLSVVTVLVASLSFYLVERPAQVLARRYLRRRSANGRAGPLAGGDPATPATVVGGPLS